MDSAFTRREMLRLTGKAAIAGALLPHLSFGREEKSSTPHGAVVGDPAAVHVGLKFLADGANAIDAAVATAFAAGITSPSKCGVGGYGGHAIVALANGKVTTIDFNSAAPAAARADMFPIDSKGKVIKQLNFHGWLAPGVPGTLAGLHLALTRYGTRSLRDILAPTIKLSEEGISVAPIKGTDEASKNDASPESFAGRKEAAKQQNEALTKLLRTLAAENSIESFYRGDIARVIAAAFKKNGGLVTFEDMAAYRAREVAPMELKWNGLTIHTPPLTAAGLTFFQAIAILKEIDWPELSPRERFHAKLEAARLAWADRAKFYGDPEKAKVPVHELLSSKHAKAGAKQVMAALKEQRAVPLKIDSAEDEGTMNISAVDKNGNMMAITLTHGSSFGARVSVDELGMVLGHGMWRFDPRPGHPNSPGPGKRAVNNMCPTAITMDGKPIIALGGAGGTRIPNSMYEVLLNCVGLGKLLPDAMNAPRLQTTGTLRVELEKSHTPEDKAYLEKLGYKTVVGSSAYLSGVSFDRKTRTCNGLSRGGVF